MKRVRRPLTTGLTAAVLASVFMGTASAGAPDCTAKEAWPASMAYVVLKNQGLLDPQNVQFSETKVTRLASERVGKDNYRQIHLVRFMVSDGKVVQAITQNNVSSRECSVSGVDVYLIDRHFPPPQ